MFAAAIDPDNRVGSDEWRADLGTELRWPAMKMPFIEAHVRHYRRVSLPLQTVLLVAWVVCLTVFSGDLGPVATARVVGIPGELVIGAVAVAYALTIAAMVWPRERKATGEMDDRDKAGVWKP